MDLEIMYEDNHILVVVKPQNVPSQEDETGDPDMLNLLKAYIKEKYQKAGNVFLGLVHRLDRPTGGVMVFARTSKAASRLFESIKQEEFDKTYLAIVDGEPREQAGRLTHHLFKNLATNTVTIVPESTEDAKKAELDYRVLAVADDVALSLVKINLITGRSHQARVQMAALSTPIYGDFRYGKRRSGENLALWATILKFPHPTTRQAMVFMAYPPEEISPWNKFQYTKFLNINKEI